MFQPGKTVVIDVYHGDVISDLVAARNAGILGVIHKVGGDSPDPHVPNKPYTYYQHRRQWAKDAGIPLWGGYWFNVAGDQRAQARKFVDLAQPDAGTLMALDLEDCPGRNLDLGNVLEFFAEGDSLLGRRMWLYSGNVIKSLIVKADPGEREFLAKHLLWGCQYGPRWRNIDDKGKVLPWPAPTLWQDSADGAGPGPHRVPGIDCDGVDSNVFDGTPEELAHIWPGAPLDAVAA